MELYIYVFAWQQRAVEWWSNACWLRDYSVVAVDRGKRADCAGVDILKEKLCGKVTKGPCSCTTMPPTHQTLVNQKELAYLGFQCLDNPHYSPGLSPMD